MKTIFVQSGFGYVKDGKGRIVQKMQLPKGEHPVGDEFEYFEVKSAKELDAIEIEEIVTPEIQAARDEFARKEAAKAKVKDLDLKAVTTVAQLKSALQDVIEFLK